MKIVVTIKQVYDPATVRVSQSRGILDTRAAELVMNPGDKYALEEALKLKDDTDASVAALSLGPPEAEETRLCFSPTKPSPPLMLRRR
jgi:electron transfer flavoprotein beta subunit